MRNLEIDQLLNRLLSQMRQTLGSKLVGLYLYGSLVSGDFIEGVSDFDLLAATAGPIDVIEFGHLDQMQLDFVRSHPEWENRVEIAYASIDSLRTFKHKVSQIAVISPGEPFHFKDAGEDWAINWWVVREQGLILYGPDPKSIIEPISHAEFIETVWDHARSWNEWVKESRHRKAQSYARLTMCRALYALTHGVQVSKNKAARWTQEQYPEHKHLIDEALAWRVAEDDDAVDHEATFQATEQFVHFMISQAQAVYSQGTKK